MKELLDIIRERRAQPAIPFALATVVHVAESSDRKLGARMLIGLQGRVAGSVSGGGLERDVITKARAIILGAPAELAVYDTTDEDDMAPGTRPGREGRIEVLLQPLAPGAAWPLADAVDLVLKNRTPLPVATAYRASAADAAWVGRSIGVDEAPAEWQAQLAPVADGVMTGKRPALAHLATPRMDILVERLAPPTRLVIFGAGHDVPALVRLAKEVGYRVTVVDRRAGFAEPERFPGADAVRHLRPQEIEASGLLDEGAAVILMNHHYETDAELLALLVSRPLAYLGMLGPRKRTSRILREARAAGARFSPEDMARLHAPIGLDLGSETPEQIALSILAEVQAVVNGRTAVQLRKRAPLLDELFGQQVMLERA